MRKVPIYLSVAFLSLLATPAMQAQSASSQSTLPEDINTAAAPAAPADNATTNEDKMTMFRRPQGIFGPVTAHLKAGDDAPDIKFTKVLHAPGTVQWNSANAFNQTTVLVFLPQLSPNQQAVDRWNALVEKFAARSVQLVLITQEQESALLPWLAQHPVSGWLLYDPTGATGKAYGLEVPNTVYVGADRRIVAFSHGSVPRDEELNAVLEGRVRTEPVKSDPASLREFAKSGKVLLQAEPSRMPSPEDHKPKFPPSYEVHIAPSTATGTSSTSAPDSWSMGGFDLKSIVARAYGVEETRVDFPDAAAAGTRYDVALVLPQPEDRDAMLRRIRDALKEKFNLKIERQDESMDVYVVTAPYGPGPELRPAEDSMGGIASSSRIEIAAVEGHQPAAEELQSVMDHLGISNVFTIDSISASSGTIQGFCKELERGLDRKVIDETHLTGRYGFNVVRGGRTRDLFFDMLRKQLGLAVTPEKRNVAMLVVRSK